MDREKKLNRRRLRRESREQLLDAMLQQEYLILITGKKYYAHPRQIKILSQKQIEDYISENWLRLLKTPEQDWELVTPFCLARRAWQEGYQEGEDIGYQEGYQGGKDAGYQEGYGKGHSCGYDRGHRRGYDEGYSEGDSHGYSSGYDDGLYDR